MFSQASVILSTGRGVYPACTGADTPLGRHPLLDISPWTQTPQDTHNPWTHTHTLDTHTHPGQIPSWTHTPPGHTHIPWTHTHTPWTHTHILGRHPWTHTQPGHTHTLDTHTPPWIHTHTWTYTPRQTPPWTPHRQKHPWTHTPGQISPSSCHCSRWYASYWNALLLFLNFESHKPFCEATDIPLLDLW